MMPSCDQIGVPIHFHSSTTAGSASLISLRILPRVSPRQSPSSAIFLSISSEGVWPRGAGDFSRAEFSPIQTASVRIDPPRNDVRDGPQPPYVLQCDVVVDVECE